MSTMPTLIPCAHCGKPATCIGVYEDPSADPAYACDTCCGHGCEDGHCDEIEQTEQVRGNRMSNDPTELSDADISKIAAESAVLAAVLPWQAARQGPGVNRHLLTATDLELLSAANVYARGRGVRAAEAPQPSDPSRPVARDNYVRFESPTTGEYLYRRATPEEIATRQGAPTPDPAKLAGLLLAERTDDAQPRPSPDRAAWLLHPVSATGRETIAATQYEELRVEAVALRARVDASEAERAYVTAERTRWKEATHKLASEALEADTDTTEARRAAAMWQERYREAEEAHARDAAVLRALRAEVERLRAPAPAGGTDRETELDRIAAAQRERMAATAPPSDDMPDPDAFDPDDPGDTVAPEDTDRAELLVSLLRRSTAELRALVAPTAPAADLDAARTDVPSHVETLANETERLRARVAELEAERTEALGVLAPSPACGSWEDELHRRADDLERYVGVGEHVSVDDAIATLRAVAEVMGRRQWPAGWRVAALLAAVSGAISNTRTATDDYTTGSHDAYITCARLVRDHLGAPSPLDGVVAEVCALAPKDVHGVENSADLSPAECADVAIRLLRAKGGRFPPTERDKMRMAARVLLTGIQACDGPAPAAPCPSALMHSTLGRLPCNVRGPHAQHVSATGERWGSEDLSDRPDFDTRAFFDDGDAAAKGGA